MRASPARILNRPELLDAIASERRAGRTIAFANGCFDILHVGHVRYLEGAAREAEVLVVGVNGDGSVEKLKGTGRPLVSALERAEMVGSLRAVDYVTVFEEESPADLIAALRPDVHCKGTDYTEDTVPEGDVVRSYGGRVAIVGDSKAHSTTELLARLKTER